MAVDTKVLLDEFERLANECRDLWHCVVKIPHDAPLIYDDAPDAIKRMMLESFPCGLEATVIATERILSGKLFGYGGYLHASPLGTASDQVAKTRCALSEFKQAAAATHGHKLLPYGGIGRYRVAAERVAIAQDGDVEIFDRSGQDSPERELDWIEHLYETSQPSVRGVNEYEIIRLPVSVIRASVLALKTLLANGVQGHRQQEPQQTATTVSAAYRKGGNLKGDILTAEKAAEILDVSESTVSRNLEDRIDNPGGKGFLYSWRAVEKYARENGKIID